jgi:hypothetical protein
MDLFYKLELQSVSWQVFRIYRLSSCTLNGVCKDTENSLSDTEIRNYPGASSSLAAEACVMMKAFNRIASSLTNERFHVPY